MPSGTFFGMQHLNNNLLCAVATKKIEHQLYEVAVIPLNSMLLVHDKILLFNMRMIPLDRDAIEGKNKRHDYTQVLLNGNTTPQVADYFEMWYQRLGLHPKKRIIPLCFDWFEQGNTLRNWLGVDRFDSMFSTDVRDVKVIANFINDNADARAEPVPYSKTEYAWIMKSYKVERHETVRSAISDARQLCDLYIKMVKRGVVSTLDADTILLVREETDLSEGKNN